MHVSEKIIVSCEWEGEGINLEKEESKIYLMFQSSINRYSITIPKKSPNQIRALQVSVEACNKENGKLSEGRTIDLLKVTSSQIQQMIMWSDLFKEIKLSSFPQLEGGQPYLLVFSRGEELYANLIKNPNDQEEFFKLLQCLIVMKLVVFEGKFCSELAKNNFFEIMEPTPTSAYEINIIKKAIKKIDAGILRNAMLKIRELQQNPNEFESICEICKHTMTSKGFFDMVYFMLKSQISNEIAAKPEIEKILNELSTQFMNECMEIKTLV